MFRLFVESIHVYRKKHQLKKLKVISQTTVLFIVSTVHGTDTGTVQYLRTHTGITGGNEAVC